tara:strand:- start:315 stop:914 length:600 start_codon:yes stop_codon:yes gene_type:complete
MYKNNNLYIIMDSFITQQNKQLLWNILIKVPLFNKIEQNGRIVWFERQINNIYQHNKNTHHSNSDLRTFNKDAITIMINILKQIPEKKTSPFEQVEDQALSNLNELVEAQKQKRELDIQTIAPNELNIIHLDEKKSVSWEDQKPIKSDVPNINELTEKIRTMELLIQNMRDEINMLKSGTYHQVNETIQTMINSLDVEN